MKVLANDGNGGRVAGSNGHTAKNPLAEHEFVVTRIYTGQRTDSEYRREEGIMIA
jgi:hypothetical protein